MMISKYFQLLLRISITERNQLFTRRSPRRDKGGPLCVSCVHIEWFHLRFLAEDSGGFNSIKEVHTTHNAQTIKKKLSLTAN